MEGTWQKHDGTDGQKRLQSFKQNIGTNILMLKCFDHNATFLDTHRHSRPAIEFSRICLIVCGGLELKDKKQQQQHKNEHPTTLTFTLKGCQKGHRIDAKTHAKISVVKNHRNHQTLCFSDG